MRIPYAQDPWNEIVSGLFMGGHWRKDPTVEPTYQNGWGTYPVVPENEFDHVISLYRRAGHGPSFDVKHSWVEFEDSFDTIDDETISRLRGLADEAFHQVWYEDKKVLVRCRAGYNRSGLLTAMILLRGGMSPEWVVNRIREKRSRYALGNSYFVDLINDEYEWFRGR